MVLDTSTESKETQKPVESKKESLSPKGIQAMQGTSENTKQAATNPDTPEETVADLTFPNQDEQAAYEEWNQTHDPANWEYKLGSPHEDYQASKDLQAAQRRYELGQQAATADSPLDAIDTTLAARKESNGEEEETPMDQYMREKYGPTPYTTEAYPKDEETDDS